MEEKESNTLDIYAPISQNDNQNYLKKNVFLKVIIYYIYFLGYSKRNHRRMHK